MASHAIEQLKGEIIDALGRKGDRQGSGRIAQAEAEPERQVA